MQNEEFWLGLPSPRNTGRQCRFSVCLGRRSISSTNQTIATRIINVLVCSITRNRNRGSSTNSSLRPISSSHVDITWHTGVIVQGDALIIGVRRGCHFSSGQADARPPVGGERTGFSIECGCPTGRRYSSIFTGSVGTNCQQHNCQSAQENDLPKSFFYNNHTISFELCMLSQSGPLPRVNILVLPKAKNSFSGCYGSTCQLLGAYPRCILYINHHHSAVLHPDKAR